MYDAMFPEATDVALQARFSRPVAPPADAPLFKGFWKSIGSAIPRAGAEIGRAGTSLLSTAAVGALDAPSMFSAPGKTPRDQLERELKAQDSAIAAAIREMTPDPQSTGMASMLLHEVTRFVGKAAAYSTLGGPVAAAAGMTLDEGINEAQRRMDEGVDAATAAKLGATKGVASGIAVALPVAGKTLTQTLGLAVAGGPGAYVAEQATAREILRAADYDKLADEIDPFDPLGLGVSFLGSFAFGAGAHLVRGRRAAARAGEIGTPAQDPATPPAMRQEHVDAAHVVELQAHRERSALRSDPAQAAGHSEALDLASRQIASGEPVQVVAQLEGARVEGEPVRTGDDLAPARAELAEIETLRAERTELLPVAGDLAEPGAIREARAELRLMEQQRPDTSEAAVRALAKDIQAQEGISYKAALSQAKKQTEDAVRDFEARTQHLEDAIATNARAQQAVQRVGEIDKRIAELEKQAAGRLELARIERDLAAALPPPEPSRPTAARPAEPARAEPQPAGAVSPEVQRQIELATKRRSQMDLLIECLGAA